MRVYFSQSARWKSRIKVRVDWISDEGLLPGSEMAVLLYITCHGTRGEGASGFSYKGINLICEDFASWDNPSPRLYFLILGIELQHRNSCGTHSVYNNLIFEVVHSYDSEMEGLMLGPLGKPPFGHSDLMLVDWICVLVPLAANMDLERSADVGSSI